MMKSWSRICFLVLAISPLSQGQNGISPTPVIESKTNQAGSSNITVTTPSITVTPSRTSEERTELTSLDNMLQATLRANDSTTAQTTIAVRSETDGMEENETTVVTTNATMTATSSSKPEENGEKDLSSDREDGDKDQSPRGEDGNKGQSSGGYVILVMIILVIISLCVILYLLRRNSRTYSFDLQRPLPVNNRDEPIGTFEPVHLDDLEPPAEYENGTTDDLSPPPVVNGTTPQTEENGSNGLSEQQDVNGLEILSLSNTGPSMSDQPVGTTSSPLDSTNLLCDAAGEEQQNENNNHPFCSNDLFVDIKIDEPTWSDLPLS